MSASGQYNVTLNTPMGAQQGVLDIQVEGSTLTGTMTGAQGALPLSDGKADGNALSWKAAMTQPMPMTLEFNAAVDGDAISGTVKLGAFGNATFAGSRA